MLGHHRVIDKFYIKKTVMTLGFEKKLPVLESYKFQNPKPSFYNELHNILCVDAPP